MSDKGASVNSLISSGQWKKKVSNHAQLGGIETSVIDNGQGHGSRIAWINTGSGLRFKVAIDRAMDVADAFYGPHSLAWLSHMGITSPNPAAIDGATWLNSFGGGLLTTCGLTHVGGPEEDEFGARGLHDRISHIPATVESIRQPDLEADQPEMSITGRILQSTVFGPHLELRRTVSARLGHPVIHIHDEVTNLGNVPAPHMLLYHINFGWPLVDAGAKINWSGSWEAPNEQSSMIFNETNDFKTCPPPMEEHQGDGEAVAFIDVDANSEGLCECGIHHEAIGLGVTVKFKKSEFPWLTNWQHWGKNEYVMALEPCTNPPVGQAHARRQGNLTELQPGDTKVYETQLSVEDHSMNEYN